MTEKTSAGWDITQSIALELDTLISFFGKHTMMQEPVQDYAGLLDAILPEWKAELPELTGKSTQGRSFLETLAIVTGQLHTTDYSAATLEMRGMDLDGFRQGVRRVIHESGLTVDLSGDDPAVLLSSYSRAVYEAYGLHPLRDPHQRTSAEMQVIGKILKGGENHDRFWHWLDRLYYEAYLPWRKTRQQVLDELEQQAVLGLGKESGDDVPTLFWLPDMNPLLRIPELKNGVENGSLKASFWVEPFALADSWLLQPREIFVTIAQPGAIYQNFYRFSNKVAQRMQALADPTRLIILRMIRNIGMNNTDMAEFLKVARPTVSIHARILREAGLIRSFAEGRSTKHEVIAEELDKLFEDLRMLLDLPDKP